MRPGAHPDFYRLPPPDGRSRESTIVLDRLGRFWHDGARVEHPAMSRAFAAWIGRHPVDGRYILDNGYDWTYLTVEDAPFFVTAVRSEHGVPTIALSDGTEEVLDAGRLWLDADDALRTRVRGGAFEARFTPYAQTALAAWLVEGPHGEPEIEVQGVRHPACRRAPPSGV